MALETLRLPNRDIHSVHPVSNASDDARDDHLNLLERGGLQDRPNDHNPCAYGDATLTPEIVRCQESDDGSNEAANIIDSSYDALKVAIWIVEFMSERVKANDGTQNTLIIAKELQSISILSRASEA